MKNKRVKELRNYYKELNITTAKEVDKFIMAYFAQ